MGIKKMNLIRFIIVVLTVVTLTLSVFPVSAQYDVSASPTNNYNYNMYGEAVKAPAFYNYADDLVTGLKAPTDLYSVGDELYVLEAGAGRIAVFSIKDKALKREICPIDEKGAKYSLEDSQGIFVTKDKKIYIALNKQQKVLETDENGNVLQSFSRPKSSLIPDDFIFSPSRVAVQKDGLIYIVSDSSYQGLLQLDEKGELISFFGSNTVTVTAGTVLNQMWRKIFNKEQQSRMENVLPTDYSSIDCPKDDFIYSVTDMDTEKEIKKHSPLGNNVLNYAVSVASGVKIGQNNYGDFESWRDANTTVETAFVDITVSDDGMIFALDSSRGRIFTYDQNSNLLGLFGAVSDQRGGFKRAVSIEENNGIIYALDSERGTVMCFEPTEYAEKLIQGSILFSDGDFESAEPIFQEVRSLNSNLPFCARGLGWAALIRGDEKQAMEYFKECCDLQGYNQAFSSLRSETFSKWFPLFFAVGVLLIIGVFLLISRMMKKAAFDPKANGRTRLNPLQVTVHPFAGFEALKDDRMGHFGWSIAVLAALCFSRALSIAYTGFLFSTTRLSDVNLITEFVQLIVLIMAFVICSWAVGTLIDSEARFKEIYYSTVYALCPYIISQLITTLLSNILLLREQAFLTMITTVGGALTLIMLMIGIIKTHKFTFGKAVVFVIIDLVGILFILFLFLMFYSLSGQLWDFIKTIASEVQYRM